MSVIPTDLSLKGIAENVGESSGVGPNTGKNSVHYQNLTGVPQPIVDLGNGVVGAVPAHAATHVQGGSDALTGTLSVDITGSARRAYYAS